MRSFVRLATQDDCESLCELLATLNSLHSSALPHVFRDVADPAWNRQHVEGILGDPNSAVFVAEDHAQVVGFVHVRVRESPSDPRLMPRRHGIVDTIYVREDRRRTGIGRRLMAEAQAWAANRGASEVELNVWEFNEAARAFCEALGYRTASRKMSRAVATEGPPRESR